MARRIKTKVDTKLLKRLAREMPDRVDAVGRGAAAQMVAEVVTSFGSGPPGRRYGKHVASSPGHPPNSDSGVLRASINWKPMGKMVYWVQDGTEYGAFLEFGTPHIEARPFLSPVFERWWREGLADYMRGAGLFDV